MSRARITTIGLMTTLCVFAFAEAHSAQIFVATTGNDTNPGTLDKPLATLQRAQLAAREAAGVEAVTVFSESGNLLSARNVGIHRRGFRYESRSGRLSGV